MWGQSSKFQNTLMIPDLTQHGAAIRDPREKKRPCFEASVKSRGVHLLDSFLIFLPSKAIVKHPAASPWA